MFKNIFQSRFIITRWIFPVLFNMRELRFTLCNVFFLYCLSPFFFFFFFFFSCNHNPLGKLGNIQVCFLNRNKIESRNQSLSHLFFWSSQSCTHGIWKFPGQGFNQSCSHWPTPQQCSIQAVSATYSTAARGNARCLTH